MAIPRTSRLQKRASLTLVRLLLAMAATLLLVQCGELDERELTVSGSGRGGTSSGAGGSNSAGNAGTQVADGNAGVAGRDASLGGTPGQSGETGEGGMPTPGGGPGDGGTLGEGGTVGQPLECEEGTRDCSGECIAETACCGSAECPPGDSCVSNACVCNEGTKRCGAVCISQSACCDEADCPEGASCADGVCQCPSGTHQCDDTCADSGSSDTCGVSCEPCQAPTGGGAECSTGQCQPTCPTGQRPCAGACIGNSVACTGMCPTGTHDCSGVCYPTTDVNACGTRCTPCPTPTNGQATCNGTSCDFTCATGFKKCGNACIANSACCENTECPSAASCTGNQCICGSGTKRCGNECIPNSACCTTAECQANATCNTAHQCQCASGFKACGSACIPNSACCTNNDCQANATCNTSRACQCASGFKACGSACIPNSACCTNAECGANRTCGTGNQCQCANGFKACAGACIANSACCTDTDCPTTATCSTGTCSCNPYYFGASCNYFFRGLGYPVATHSSGEAAAVSGNGTTVVGHSLQSGVEAEAFRWQNGVFTRLGFVMGGSWSRATAVNNTGTIVVGDAHVPGTSSVNTMAFQWVLGGAMNVLPPPEFGTYNYARGISLDGSVVVGYGDRDGESRAIRWLNGGVGTTSGVDPIYLMSVKPNSTASSIVSGGYMAAGAAPGAPILMTTSTPTTLGTLANYPGGAVLAVSSTTTNIAAGYVQSAPNVTRAVRWSGTTATDLGTLGGNTSRALAISGNGAVVVGVSNGTAFIWDATNGMRSLTTVLTQAGVNLTSWTLQSATGISTDGKTIVGNARHGSLGEPWIVRLP